MFKPWDPCLDNGVATIDCLPIVFSNVVNGILMFLGIFALILFIISGFRYINSGGDSKKLEGARNTLIYAIIGLSIVVFSFAIINLISYVTGVESIRSFGWNLSP